MSLLKISTMPKHLTISGNIIAKHDPDRYFLSLLAPVNCQQDIWPVLAFYYETARIREVVTDTTMGLIRLQWWKDAIKNFYEAGIVAPHEIMLELANVITKHKIPQHFFQNMLLAREFDVEDKVPTHLDGMLNYIQFTHTPLLKMIAMILPTNIDDRALQSLSLSYGIVGILRSFVFHARSRRCYLPADRIVSLEDIYQFKNTDNLKSLIKDLCDHAEKLSNSTTVNIPLFKGMKALIRLYIQQIRHVDYNLISPKLSVPPAFKQLRVTLSVLLS
jgi:NADH dehydrogenase [ubiquinone] 1 alpha subcomplex assembly factor 6